MNLAIEYLTRNSVLKDFFVLPCSLFLESFCKTKRLVVVFDKHPNKDYLIQINKYNLLEWSQSGFPNSCVAELDRHLIFKNEIFLNKDFCPIVYQENPINTRFNSYNHPMNKEEYENFVFNFLNSSIHRSYKKDWLWDSFTAVYLAENILQKKMQLPTIERRCVVEEEKRYVRHNRPRHWRLWKLWTSRLFFKETIATELIFWHYFFKKINYHKLIF